MIELVCVGKPRGALADAARDYEKRLARACKLTVVELREESLQHLDAREAMGREARRIEPRLAGAHVVVLDRSGRAFSSEQLAVFVREREELPPQRTLFVIGGASGLDPSIVVRADTRWSLGGATLPHQLARVVVGEQLYRAFAILRGEPYHR